MALNDWKVGQKVVVHLPYANQGDAKKKDAVITKIGAKYVYVDAVSTRFYIDHGALRSEGSTGGYSELYTPEGYEEMRYCVKVLLEMAKSAKTLPLAILLQVGDHLGVARPNHLRDDLDSHLLDIIQRNV